jgi:glucose/arabinose dehydrogenase
VDSVTRSFCPILLLGATLAVAPAYAQLQAQVFVQGLNQPVAFIQDPSTPTTHYVVEQPGRIRIVVNGTLQGTPFLDLSTTGADLVLAGGERGLLGLAFPSDYATSRRFYVNYTRKPDGHTVIARYKRSTGNPQVADPTSRFDLVWPNEVGGATQLLPYILQPASNHNGGNLRFGPDGYLYIGLGDGGGSGDTYHNAQNPKSLLGKMLRVDVSVADNHARGFVSPADNPFRDGVPISAYDEIWAFGLRNPWRYSFDPPALGGTGAMFVGDVGQGAREEISYQPPGAGGRNYGWPLREGFIAYPSSDPAAYTPLLDPLYDYPRTFGQAVTGGYVYRGTRLPAQYRGRYFFADYQNRKVASIAYTANGSGEAVYTASSLIDHTTELGGSNALGFISSVDIDAQGEIYLSSLSTGRILRITSPTQDTDSDGLPDAWEIFYGLDPNSSAGVNGAGGDPDGDGQTNAAEYQSGTHPRGVAALSRHLAEGATSSFFDTAFAILNPTGSPAAVLFRFLKPNGSVSTHALAVPAGRRATLDAKSVAGLSSSEFATTVETDVEVVVDRTMSWDASGYGSHVETAQTTPATTWYFAEGATHSGFDLFYLLQNTSTATTSQGQIRFLRPSGAPVLVPFSLAPGARQTIWVDNIAALSATDVAGVVEVTNGVPIIAERAMYLSGGGQTFRAGHESAGVSAPSTSWFLAEGATGSYFNEFILLANPGATAATATVTYLRQSGGPLQKAYTVPANSRRNIWLNAETVGAVSLASESLSASIVSTAPIVVERAMWWPGPSAIWFEAHNSFGSRVTGTRWALAEGEVGGARAAETYILIANTSNAQASVQVSLSFEDGTTVSPKTFVVAANRRFSVDVAAQFGAAVAGKRFGAVVQSLGATPAPIVVERAIYQDAGGVRWAAGTNALAARLQ